MFLKIAPHSILIQMKCENELHIPSSSMGRLANIKWSISDWDIVLKYTMWKSSRVAKLNSFSLLVLSFGASKYICYRKASVSHRWWTVCHTAETVESSHLTFERCLNPITAVNEFSRLRVGGFLLFCYCFLRNAFKRKETSTVFDTFQCEHLMTYT